MVKSLKASEIYASQLVHLGYGHPLWHPEPTKFGDVEIGDVGYVDDGCFYRLFNAIRSMDDPANKDGVPADFIPLRLRDELRHRQTNVVKPGEPLKSDSVQKRKAVLSAELPTGPVSAGGGYSYSFSGKRGALAVFKDGGVQETVTRSVAFQEYIYAHHMSWHALARHRGIAVRVEDIVLVSGWTKTSGWAIATYDKQDRSHDISLSINANALLSTKSVFSFEENHELGLRHREGPPLPQSPSGSPTSPKSRIGGKDSVHPTDQCLFLQYYKCRPRMFGLTTIRKPQNLEARDMMDNVTDECLCAPFVGFMDWWKQCFRGHLQGVEDEDQDDPSERSLEDPITALLEYISESSKAEVAVTSHTDLYDLFRDVKWPAKISTYLQERRPQITVEGNRAQVMSSTPPSVPEKMLPACSREYITTVDRGPPSYPPSVRRPNVHSGRDTSDDVMPTSRIPPPPQKHTTVVDRGPPSHSPSARRPTVHSGRDTVGAMPTPHIPFPTRSPATIANAAEPQREPHATGWDINAVMPTWNVPSPVMVADNSRREQHFTVQQNMQNAPAHPSHILPFYPP